MSDNLTCVQLQSCNDNLKHRLLFGAHERTIYLDADRQIAGFKPYQVFGYERWSEGKFGATQWSIIIGMSAAPGDTITQLPGIKPGAILLGAASGKVACKRLICAIERIQVMGCPTQIDVAGWRQITGRVLANLPFDTVIARALSRC